jgi:hypothetical protein
MFQARSVHVRAVGIKPFLCTARGLYFLFLIFSFVFYCHNNCCKINGKKYNSVLDQPKSFILIKIVQKPSTISLTQTADVA